MEQRTEEWYAARMGKTTGTHILDIMPAVGKTTYKASRKNYRMTKVQEIMSGTREDNFVSDAMQWGIDHEEEGAMVYEMTTGNFLTHEGFIDHPTLPRFGISPDGLVGLDGTWELKCPNTAQHSAMLRYGKIDRAYILQMQAGLAVTGRKWCDFMSYDPRTPGCAAFWIRRVMRDDLMIARILNEVISFDNEVQDEIKFVAEYIKQNEGKEYAVQIYS